LFPEQDNKIAAENSAWNTWEHSVNTHWDGEKVARKTTCPCRAYACAPLSPGSSRRIPHSGSQCVFVQLLLCSW
jgi:hypothetical protein